VKEYQIGRLEPVLSRKAHGNEILGSVARVIEGKEMEGFSSEPDLLWECKECHRLIQGDENVAYHIVGGALYGWCEACFSGRSVQSKAA